MAADKIKMDKKEVVLKKSILLRGGTVPGEMVLMSELMSN